MHTYTWDEYYEKFYDWSESTQIRNLSALTSLGDADEVGEIILELQGNVPASNRLLKKAVEAKLAFSASDLLDFLYINDKALATAAVYHSANRLTAEDMEEFYGVIDDKVIKDICQKRNPAPAEGLCADAEDFDILDADEAFEAPTGSELLGTALVALGALAGKKSPPDAGR